MTKTAEPETITIISVVSPVTLGGNSVVVGEEGVVEFELAGLQLEYDAQG